MRRVPRLSRDVRESDFSDGNDKTAAMEAEGFDATGAKVVDAPTKRREILTPEAYAYLTDDPIGRLYRQLGLLGERGRAPISWESLQKHCAFKAQESGNADYKLTLADARIIISEDTSVPATVTECDFCHKPFETAFVKVAMIDFNTGELWKNSDGSTKYRGQAIHVRRGEVKKVVVLHQGENCIFPVADWRQKRKLNNKRDLLPAQSYEQAVARMNGVSSNVQEKSSFKNEFLASLGATGNENGERKRYASHIPSIPRGTSRQENLQRRDRSQGRG